MTTLLLRADARPSLGVGHLSRCVALAEAAVARGWRVFFAGEVVGADWLAERLVAIGVPMLPAAPLAPQAVEVGADVVLVDHYELGEQPEVREVARLVSLEDGHFGRRAADVVVDANLYTVPRPADGTPVVLAGPRFAALRADVVAARAPYQANGTPRVVVVMGGGARGEAVEAALNALRDTGLPMSVRAISAEPVAVVPGEGQTFTVGRPTTALPALLAEADLVVSAAGVTLLELCCVGAPAALVRLADNQAAGYSAALTQGLAAGLGEVADLPAAVDTLRALLTDPAARAGLASAALSTVDGQGADRILDACELSVRPASSADADLLLAWRNDPSTVAWSRDSRPVAADEHRTWLGASLDDPDRLLFVVAADRPVGTVRFDRAADGAWEVSITVAPAERGRGLAGRVLAMGEGALFANAAPTRLLANVHRDNAASLALFHRAGYVPIDRPADGSFGWLAKPSPPRL